MFVRCCESDDLCCAGISSSASAWCGVVDVEVAGLFEVWREADAQESLFPASVDDVVWVDGEERFEDLAVFDADCSALFDDVEEVVVGGWGTMSSGLRRPDSTKTSRRWAFAVVIVVIADVAAAVIATARKVRRCRRVGFGRFWGFVFGVLLVLPVIRAVSPGSDGFVMVRG